MKNLLLSMTAALALGAAANTYWAKAAASGATPPKCFVWYADEACTQAASVTPARDDGNTYVVLGSSKMTGKYTAPAGTSWIFGTDGVAVGTKKARPSFYTNGGVTLNYGDCTIYGIQAMPNSAGNLTWAGTNTFVNCGQDFTFQVANAESAASRGVDLAGRFIADADVRVNLTRAGGQNGSTSWYILSGDFTDFKGRFTASNGDLNRNARLRLTSVSAFGDPSVVCADYLTVNSFVTLEIREDVRQYATKGIKLNLAANQTNFVYAAEATPWTLTAPLTGTAGTLAKTGAGTLTLATSVQIGDIAVDEGTLVVDSAASFAEGTRLYVAPGAQVVSRLGLNIPNVAVTVAQGGGFAFDFTAPYDGTSVTTLDMTTLPASDWNALAKPVPVQLSQAIVLPFDAPARFAVARFPSTLGVTAADFRDATPKTYGLPVTSFEVVREDGCDTLYLVARPVVRLMVSRATIGTQPCLMKASHVVGGEEVPTWSDGQTPHDGADYLVDNGTDTVTASDWGGVDSRLDFPGESLTYANGAFTTKTARNVFKRLVLYPDVEVRAHGFTPADGLHMVEGCLELVSGNVRFLGTQGETGGKPYRAHFDVAAKVTGASTLIFSGTSKGFGPRFSGDGSGFTGTVRLEMVAESDAYRTALRVSDIRSVLADRAVANPRAFLAAANYTGFRITEDTVLEDVMYGVALAGYGCFFDVDAGKTLTLNGDLRFQSQLAAKYGPGVLALGGRILYTYDGLVDPDTSAFGAFPLTLHVNGGWVKPHAWSNAASYRYMRFRFNSASAGLGVDPNPPDAHVAKYGLCLHKPDAVQFGTGVETLAVKVLLPEDDAPVDRTHVLPVLTVPDALAGTLEGRLSVVKNFRNATATVASAPAPDLAGFTTFTATLRPSGLVVLVK